MSSSIEEKTSVMDGDVVHVACLRKFAGGGAVTCSAGAWSNAVTCAGLQYMHCCVFTCSYIVFKHILRVSLSESCRLT